jgi:hypothetical protein
MCHMFLICLYVLSVVYLWLVSYSAVWWIYVYVYVCVCMCMYAHMYVCMYAHMYVCMYVCITFKQSTAIIVSQTLSVNMILQSIQH